METTQRCCFLMVESSFNMSNFYEHCEAVVNFEKVVTNKVEGQYRQKKHYKIK